MLKQLALVIALVAFAPFASGLIVYGTGKTREVNMKAATAFRSPLHTLGAAAAAMLGEIKVAAMQPRAYARVLAREARVARTQAWAPTDDLTFAWTPSEVAAPAEDLDFCWRAEATPETEEEIWEIPSSYIYYIDYDEVHNTGF